MAKSYEEYRDERGFQKLQPIDLLACMFDDFDVCADHWCAAHMCFLLECMTDLAQDFEEVWRNEVLCRGIVHRVLRLNKMYSLAVFKTFSQSFKGMCNG